MAGTTIGSTGMTRRIRSRGGNREAHHARNVPSTSAMANEPRASSTVVRMVSPIPGWVKAVR
jgi:hypothetical protein